MADGSIRVSTKLDTKETKVDLKKLEQECEKTAQSIEQAGEKIKGVFTGITPSKLSSAFKTANKELGETEKALAAVESKIAEIQADTDKSLPQAATDDQAANLLAIEEIQMAPLLKQRDELIAKAAEYRQQMEAIIAELNEQANAETAQKALKTSGKDAVDDAKWLGKIKTQQQFNAALSTTQSKMAAIEQQAERISHETGIPRQKLLEQDAEYQKLARRQELLIKNQDRFKNKVQDSTNKTKKLGKDGSTSVNKLGTAVSKGIKKLGKMALAAFGVRAAYMAVRRAANAYMEDNEQLSQQISSLWNIAGQAIGPVIEVMVKGISTVVMWVNSLIKALTGVDLVAKANAAALKKQASATTAAAKAAQLAGFDEINKLNEDSSGGGGGASVGTFDTSMVFDIPDFMKKIKEQILSGDWFGAGETLGQSLMDGIESIDWWNVGNTIGDAIVNAAQFALGFILNIDPTTLYSSIYSFLGGLLTGVAEGIQELDWEGIGGDILELLLFGLGMAIATSNPAAGLIMLILTPNGEELASGLAELAGSVLGALCAALVGAVTRLGEKIGEVWTSIKEYFDDYVDWEGTPDEIIEGLFEGIKDALEGIGNWILTNIWEPFKEGFCEAFGIHSPSTKMKTFGESLIDGLKEGIGDIWVKVKTKFDDFKKKITTFKDDIKKKAEEAGTKFVEGLKDGLNNVKNKVKEPINAVIGFFEKAINYIIDKLNKLSFTVPSWVSGIGGKKFGFSMSKVSIPRLAKGGIVNNPGRGVLATVGEAGTEAVLPLENNTEWMDLLAEKINAGVQKIVVPIYLNGRKIAEEVIDLTNRRNFATNGAF